MNPNRHVVITGGEGDLASAICSALQKTGGYEVYTPARNQLDVKSADSVREYFKTLPQVDILINNAGIIRDSSFVRMSELDWDEVLKTNLRGAFLCSQAALKQMSRQRSGHIIQIGSYSAIHPPIGQANYAAAKAGLIGLTKSLALEMGKRNIRINCVLPGFLETKMTSHLSPETVDQVKDSHALGRFNTVTEAASFITWLVETENLSGQVFQLDSRVN